MKALHICLFTGTFLPQIGGAELSLHHLTKGFQRRGHSPVVLSRKMQGDIASWDIDYPVHWFPRFQHFFLVLEKLRSPFDILFVNGIYPCGYVAAKLRKLLRVPIVVSCPGEDIQKIPDIGYGRRLNPTIDQRVRWAVHQVDGLFAIVPAIRKEFESLGVPKERIWDVPHGSDPARFEGIPSIRSLFDIPDDHRILLLLGRNHEKKDYPDFIRSMPSIAKQHPKVRAVIVGKGTEKLAPLAAELGVEDQVILSPPFTWAEYPRLFVGADIYVSPSLGEGFSLALADALAAGLPQVVCDVEGCRDVVDNEQTGLIVPPRNPEAMAQAIGELLTNREHYNRLSDGAKSKAKTFHWDVIVDKHLEIYRQLIQEHQSNK
jgi:glycosyltransferase involved in cell wall biosynthesis